MSARVVAVTKGYLQNFCTAWEFLEHFDRATLEMFADVAAVRQLDLSETFAAAVIRARVVAEYYGGVMGFRTPDGTEAYHPLVWALVFGCNCPEGSGYGMSTA
jgi:hypothetical protein